MRENAFSPAPKLPNADIRAIEIIWNSSGRSSVIKPRAPGQTDPYTRPTILAENMFSRLESINHIIRCITRATAVFQTFVSSFHSSVLGE